VFDLHRALPLLEKAAQIISDTDPAHARFSTRVYQDLGVNWGRAEEALCLFKKLFLLSDDKLCTTTCEALMKMASCHTLMGQFRKVLAILHRASEIARELHDPGLLINCTLSIGKAHTSCSEVKIAFIIARKEIMWKFCLELSRCSLLCSPK